MATKQDQTKKILKKLSKEEIGRITLELSKIPLFKASVGGPHSGRYLLLLLP